MTNRKDVTIWSLKTNLDMNYTLKQVHFILVHTQELLVWYYQENFLVKIYLRILSFIKRYIQTELN